MYTALFFFNSNPPFITGYKKGSKEEEKVLRLIKKVGRINNKYYE